MRIAVAGGTGVVGRHVVEIARGRGHEVTVLARSRGVDLTTGEGLDLTGIRTVIDVTSVPATSARRPARFFTAVTGHLLAAERAAGVAHHLMLSIVGIDDAPYGYYAGKVAQERLVRAGEVPWTILRATQFHEFAGQIHQRMRLGPIVFVPAMQAKPVAAREVAARLVELAEAGPAARAPDLVGPRVERMAELSRRWAAATGARGRVLEARIPGGFGRAMRNGTLLARAGSQQGEQTFEEWLGMGQHPPRVERGIGLEQGRRPTPVVLLLALGVLAVTRWLPALLFLPAAGGVLLVHEYGSSMPGRSPRDNGHPRD